MKIRNTIGVRNELIENRIHIKVDMIEVECVKGNFYPIAMISASNCVTLENSKVFFPITQVEKAITFFEKWLREARTVDVKSLSKKGEYTFAACLQEILTLTGNPVDHIEFPEGTLHFGHIDFVQIDGVWTRPNMLTHEQMVERAATQAAKEAK